MSKPSLFIGSSSEGLAFAQAVRAGLEADAEVTIWDEGVFPVGQTFIEALFNALPRFDFAVMVLTADDPVFSRQAEAVGPRDNVLFELGLFMGRLGRSRTFVLHQATADLKIPTDLSGLVTATYDWPRADGNRRSAVGSACDSIRQIVRDLGVVEAKTSRALVDLRSRQEVQGQELVRQQTQIRTLSVALQGIVTIYEYEKLTGLQADAPFMCYYSDGLWRELKHLRAMGFVRHHEGTGLTVMKNDYKDRDAKFDLHRYFYITESGVEYLTLRREIGGIQGPAEDPDL